MLSGNELEDSRQYHKIHHDVDILRTYRERSLDILDRPASCYDNCQSSVGTCLHSPYYSRRNNFTTIVQRRHL